MRITERVVGEVVILSLSGKFVFDTRKDFQKAIEEAKAKTPQKIVLNLEACTYIDSAGLGLLAICFEQAKLQNLEVCLVNPKDAVKRTIELTQLPKIMKVHDAEEQALRLTLSPLSMAR
jgi:anti-sigma B factor antagonist